VRLSGGDSVKQRKRIKIINSYNLNFSKKWFYSIRQYPLNIHCGVNEDGSLCVECLTMLDKANKTKGQHLEFKKTN
jgi:hypothetical protein